MNDLLRRVAAADPAPAAAPPDDEARRTLATILATPGPARPRARRRAPRLVLGGAVAAAVVGAYVVVAPAGTPMSTPRAYALTPPLLAYAEDATPARPVLLGLAARAERQPRHAAGRYDFVRTRGWYLNHGGLPSQGYFRDVSERDFWIGDDGSGRIAETRTREDGTVEQHGPSGAYAAGTLSGRRPIPADPAALRERLYAEPGWDTVQWIDAVAQAWTQQAIEPDEAAVLLRALADRPDLVSRGTVTDRAGRRGLVVSADSRRTGMAFRELLVLDPQTGLLLGHERVALERGDLPFDAPVTVSYTVLLASGRTDSTETRP